MAEPKRGHQRWTSAEERKLADLADHNTPTRVIGIKLERSEAAVRSKANELGVSLAPPNQSPYGTRRRK